MRIVEIKTQYDGNKCSKCGREIKKGWTAYMDADASPKKIYCQPCGKPLASQKDSPGQPEDLSSIAKFDDINFKLKSLQENVDKLLNHAVRTLAIVEKYIEEQSGKPPAKTTKKK